MGMSPAIHDLDARDRAFHMYLTGIRTQLDTQANDMSRRVADQAARGKAADAKVMVTGRNIDLLDSPSALNNLQSVINTTTSAVLTGLSAPAGVTVASTAHQTIKMALSPSITDMSTPELFISGKAFDTISNIIYGFDSSAAVAFNSSLVSQDLGFGLQMFVGVGGQTFASSGLFGDKPIYAFAYAYEVYYSAERVEEFNRQAILDIYTRMLTAFENKRKSLVAPNPSEDEAMQKYQAAIAWLDSHIAQVKAQIDQLQHGG